MAHRVNYANMIVVVKSLFVESMLVSNNRACPLTSVDQSFLVGVGSYGRLAGKILHLGIDKRTSGCRVMTNKNYDVALDGGLLASSITILGPKGS